MATELLTDTINIDVITDMIPGLSSLIPALTSGFLIVFFIAFLMNIFLAGGLFTILSGKKNKQNLADFFAGGASSFWSFLLITLITTLIILFSGALIGGIPIAIVSSSGSGTPEPGAMGRVVRIVIIIMALLLPLLILAADFARAWQVSHDERKPFKAIGFGFRMTFRTFLLSYPLMLVIMLVQVAYVALVMSRLLAAKPVTGGGVFLLFLGSQLLFVIRILLRAWRYGCVTSVMEDNIMVPAVAHEQKASELWPVI
jgi:small-conductance mechanosensitive channel